VPSGSGIDGWGPVGVVALPLAVPELEPGELGVATGPGTVVWLPGPPTDGSVVAMSVGALLPGVTGIVSAPVPSSLQAKSKGKRVTVQTPNRFMGRSSFE
jgi:hypothetical protein